MSDSLLYRSFQAILQALTNVKAWAEEHWFKCYQASARILASVWESFVDFVSSLTELVKNQLSKIRVLFCYSSETTRLSRTISQDGQTHETEIHQRNIQLDVRYNHDGEEQVPETQDECNLQLKKKQAVEEVKIIKSGLITTFDKIVKLMEDDIETDDPEEKVKSAKNVQQFLDSDEARRLIKSMDTVPKLIT